MSDLSVRADFSAWGRLGTGMQHIGPAVIHEATFGVARLVAMGEGRARTYVRTDTRRLRNSLTHRVRATAAGVVGEFGSALPYAAANESGRRPGKMPPRGVLVRSGWLRRHGIPDDREFVVRRAIARRGIEAQPFVGRALRDDVVPHVHGELRSAAERALRGLLAVAR